MADLQSYKRRASSEPPKREHSSSSDPQEIELNKSTTSQETELHRSTTPATEALQDDTPTTNSNRSAYFTVFVLFTINLLNYMDRFTVSGVLLDIQAYYHIGNSDAGLLQTSFICSYMVLSPVFGFMGDRYSRKVILIVGILFWSAVTLAGSFVPQDMYWLFVFFRALVGIGEATYSTIAPTIIADLFVKDQRSNMLACFFFAIPVGSGLGYIVGAHVALLFNDWKYALRVTPALGVICVLALAFLVREPERGEAEGTGHLEAGNWCKDLAALFKNHSFVLCTLGFTCVAFVAGALAFWAPPFIIHSIAVQGTVGDQADVALKFGIITCVAGIVGVSIGSQSAKFLRRTNPRADPLVCATGLLLCSPFLFASLVVSEFNTTVTWLMIFFGELMLCLNWSVVTDIVLYVVTPTRRSTAEAFQILFSHLLGDAGSPYLIGVISEMVKDANPEKGDVINDFQSLQYAMYSTTFVAVLGGGFFLACALTVEADKSEVEKVVNFHVVVNQWKEPDKAELPEAEVNGFENPALQESTTNLDEAAEA